MLLLACGLPHIADSLLYKLQSIVTTGVTCVDSSRFVHRRNKIGFRSLMVALRCPAEKSIKYLSKYKNNALEASGTVHWSQFGVGFRKIVSSTTRYLLEPRCERGSLIDVRGIAHYPLPTALSRAYPRLYALSPPPKDTPLSRLTAFNPNTVLSSLTLLAEFMYLNILMGKATYL